MASAASAGEAPREPEKDIWQKSEAQFTTYVSFASYGTGVR
jgi:hypothetical protein